MAKKRYFVLMAHCLLNPTTRVHVLGHGFNLSKSIMDYFITKQIAIIQLPCPEFMAMGFCRNPQGRQQYNNVFFRKHCQKLLEPFEDMIVELVNHNHIPLCYVGVANSPTCSIHWGKHKPNRHGTESIHEDLACDVTESKLGVMTEVLEELLNKHQIHIPLVEAPLKENIVSEPVHDFFKQLDDLLGIAEEFRTPYEKFDASSNKKSL